MGKGCLACGRFFHNECLDSLDNVCCCKRSGAEATAAAVLLNPYAGIVARAAKELSTNTSDETQSGSGSVEVKWALKDRQLISSTVPFWSFQSTGPLHVTG